MAGRIHTMIDQLIEQRSGGSSVGAAAVRVRLLLRGIDPDQYDANSPDDPTVIAQLEAMAADFSTGSNMTGGAR